MASNIKKKILVAVTGMSPQIVTETLYALYAHHNWVPEEIHILTTGIGSAHLGNALLGENGFFARLCQEYHLPQIHFNADCIHVIHDENGQHLPDIRTPQQNNLAADMIVRFIYDLCADTNTELHVSIAGGRKSMGFYIGYALSLFGRRQDRLSHVLVEEAFEQNREFFYPPKGKKLLNTTSGMRDAAQAQIMLAEIPFVRMSEGIPKLELTDAWNFSQAVAMTQKSLGDFRLILNDTERTITCGSANPIKLSPQIYCLYRAMADFRLEDRTLYKTRDEADMNDLKDRYLHYYKYCKPHLRSKDLDIGSILSESASRIKSKLEQELGDYAQHYIIASTGKNNNKGYFLAIDKEQIKFS